MQALSTKARWLFSLLFTAVLLPIVVHLIKHWLEGTSIYEQPQETAGAVMRFIVTIAQSPWVQGTALFLGGLTLGVWIDWLLRKFDGSRKTKLSLLGYDMKGLGQEIGDTAQGYGFVWPDHIHMERAQLTSMAIKAKQFGLWFPGPEIFRIRSGANILANYLYVVGSLLVDEHFTEARAMALDAKGQIETEVGKSVP
jgi:hypothetical protein